MTQNAFAVANEKEISRAGDGKNEIEMQCALRMVEGGEGDCN